MRTSVLPYEERKRIQTISAVGSIALHLLLLIVLSLVMVWHPKAPELIELDWGSSSGAPNQTISESEANPDRQRETVQPAGTSAKSKVDLPAMRSPSETSLPSSKKKDLQSSTSNRRAKASSEVITSSRHRRSREGIAGGAGKSTGYSIDWSGVGSRRLLSGRIPHYPEGTDKEMPVSLQFGVLPDGSITSIIPLRRSDEILEREAISALRTWRFDPLPPQFEQKSQIGKITFIFKLEVHNQE